MISMLHKNWLFHQKAYICLFLVSKIPHQSFSYVSSLARTVYIKHKKTQQTTTMLSSVEEEKEPYG